MRINNKKFNEIFRNSLGMICEPIENPINIQDCLNDVCDLKNIDWILVVSQDDSPYLLVTKDSYVDLDMIMYNPEELNYPLIGDSFKTFNEVVNKIKESKECTKEDMNKILDLFEKYQNGEFNKVVCCVDRFESFY